MFALNRRFTLLDSVRAPIQIAPGRTCLYITAVTAAALIPSAQVMAVAAFIAAVGSGSSLFLPALALFSLLALRRVLTAAQSFFKIGLNAALRDSIRTAYFDKLSHLEYKHIESNHVQELISRLYINRDSTDCLDECFAESFASAMTLIGLLVQIVSLLSVVISYAPTIGIVLTACILPLLWVALRMGERDYGDAEAFRKQSIASGNLGAMLVLRPAAMERFLFSFSEKLNRKWAQNYRVIADNMVRICRHEYLAMTITAFAGTVFGMASLLGMAVATIYGRIEQAVFLALATGVLSLCAALSSDALTDLAYKIAFDRHFYENLTAFSALSETEEKGHLDAPAEFETLEFRNVRFRYPGTEPYILDGVNLIICRGKHYAFVGANGAGKTTVTKLILGLYDNYEGEILLNDRELREYTAKARRTLFAAVFQDFVHYEITLDENIRLGKPEASAEDIAAAVESAGLTETLAALPEGGRTLLGKLRPGGTDLSGGQWQRIAMARCAVNPAQVKILDEPTAALDPIAESGVYERFDELSRGATTVFISHRLGSTSLADVIYVFENGKVIESGSHIELMKLQGRYCQMYESQRSWYL